MRFAYPPYGPWKIFDKTIKKFKEILITGFPLIKGMTYPCRDDGIVEFGFDFQIEA
uniref:Uncharacterized protein n=1 Tax=Candidatus Kentrum sp. UNK TaxID=2126344 RepID=A0A451B222_9GAMM|nr:MAG: hypothetical protein BECKUNK1418H_GA0071006_11074 [Candidatus Kentron sp. UNK]